MAVRRPLSEECRGHVVPASSRYDRNDIIYNPERHFVLGGVKWMGLDEVKNMKLSRDEADFAKDIIDVVNIDALFL